MPDLINVVGEDDKPLSPTYSKRARQLVKSQRACWIDENTIRILRDINEGRDVNEMYMSNGPQNENVQAQPHFGYEPEPYRPYSGLTDEELYKFAKKRVKERNGLIQHIVAYAVMNAFLFFMSISNGDFWNFYVLGGWGIGLACHITSYIFNSNPDTVQREYEKLRGGRR